MPGETAFGNGYEVTISVPCICGWMVQWNLYVPGLPGAVNVPLPLPLTDTLKLFPSSAVRVWVTGSAFFTVIFVPALTVNAVPKENPEIVIAGPAAGTDEPDAGLVATVLPVAPPTGAPEEPPHAAAATTASGTRARSRVRAYLMVNTVPPLCRGKQRRMASRWPDQGP